MQTEKRNVLIVVIAAVVIIGVAIGLFFLISFVKDRNYKKEHWFGMSRGLGVVYKRQTQRRESKKLNSKTMQTMVVTI